MTIRTACELYDPVFRRGSEFYDEYVLRDFNEDGSPDPIDLNGYLIEARILSEDDVDGAIISVLTVLPIDLANGLFGYYQTADETNAFDAAERAGWFYLTITDVDGRRTILRSGELSVRNRGVTA